MRFHENFSKFRKSKGLTQEEIAETLQVSRQSVSKWENGEAIPDLAKIIKIAELLDVSIDALCGREMLHRLDTNQNIRTEQDIKVAFKSHPAITIVLSIIIAVVFGLSGYFVGHITNNQSDVYELPDTIEVSNVNFRIKEKGLVCTFIPEIYSDQLTYTVIIINELEHKSSHDVTFNDGIATANLNLYINGFHKIILQVSNGQEQRNISLVKKLYVDMRDNSLTIY